MQPEDIAKEIALAPLPIEQKLSWHFANFAPPVPETMIPVSVQAIAIAKSGGNLMTQLELPEGSTYEGGNTAPAGSIIDGHHLSYFITAGE